MPRTIELDAVLRIKITNAGERNVTYAAELILSKNDKFALQRELLTTELTSVAVKAE
uniref:Uncharacterized protein n=1 Tax=viral metagenome TaxID=1070528 RepID=A0A6M3LXR0_9ZZZZ